MPSHLQKVGKNYIIRSGFADSQLTVTELKCQKQYWSHLELPNQLCAMFAQRSCAGKWDQMSGSMH